MVHFSDWPLPKPWRAKTKSQWDNALPESDLNDERDNEREDRSECSDRFVWTSLYEDYEYEKKQVCDGQW